MVFRLSRPYLTSYRSRLPYRKLYETYRGEGYGREDDRRTFLEVHDLYDIFIIQFTKIYRPF